MAGDVIGWGTNIGDFAEFHHEPAELLALIEMHGTGCELKVAVQCPCRRIETGAPRGPCPHCKGMGWAYPSSEPMMALLHSRAPRVADNAPGWEYMGSIRAVFPLPYIPARGDQIRPDCEEHVVQETLVRARHEVDARAVRARPVDHQAGPRRYDASDVNVVVLAVPTVDDVLLYDSVTAIESVHWITPRPGAADERLVAGRPGVDFDLVGGRLRWHPGRGPEAGESYSVRYRAPAAYVVLDQAPVLRSEGGVAFPYAATLMRLDRLAQQDLR